MIDWCLLIKDKYIKLILSGKKTWEIRTKKLFKTGERIALGNTKTKNIEGYATITEIKEMTVQELKKHNDSHQAAEGVLQGLREDARGRGELQVQEDRPGARDHSVEGAAAEVLPSAEDSNRKGTISNVRFDWAEEDGVAFPQQRRHRLGEEDDRPEEPQRRDQEVMGRLLQRGGRASPEGVPRREER